ncbi:MAG: alpha/beta hydrolase fold domain-containing protein [Anaerofustis sp.]
MSEPRPYRYEEFPASDDMPNGMRTLPKDDSAVTVRYIHNVPYAVKDGEELHLQIFVPKSSRAQKFGARGAADKTYPLVVYVPGSEWLKQDVYANLPQLSRFAVRGYVLAVAEYRHSGIALFPAQVQDCLSAARYMQAHAAEYKADPNRTVLWGDSSGGHTVAMAGVGFDVPEYNSERNLPPVKLCGVVDYYGPTSIDTMNDVPSMLDHRLPESPEGRIIGGLNVLEHRDKADAMKPMRHISKDKALPPFLIMHGNKDRSVPFRQSVIFYEALRDAGKDVTFYKMDEADHADPVFWTEGTFDIVDAFMQRVTK